MSWNFLGFHLSKSRPPSWSLMRPYKTPQFHRASILPWVLPSGRLTELYQICPKTRWGLHRISFGATFPQTTPDHGPICTSMIPLHCCKHKPARSSLCKLPAICHN
ncbi:hypothetical protein QR685DRAFT_339961 [Neurospora intermedia]|uniref:Uncharacterized protein n=1 Tax=Neurospora intermedia TaxID=5142 RepID=A0ABR3D9G4_NEUIN